MNATLNAKGRNASVTVGYNALFGAPISLALARLLFPYAVLCQGEALKYSQLPIRLERQGHVRNALVPVAPPR